MPLKLIEKLTIADIRNFRSERIKKIKKGETPKPLDKPNELAKIVLHIVPMGAFEPSKIFNLSQLCKDFNTVKPPYSSVWNGQYSFDGCFTYGHSISNTKGKIGSYVQIYHNGIIEVVDLRLLLDRCIKGQAFRQGLIQALPVYLSIQKSIGVELPIFVILSMLQVRGYNLAPEDSFESTDIDQDDLLLPEIQIDKWGSDLTQLMKPVFDIVWNSLGLPESPD